jgi:DNA gyrase subunit A
VNLLPLSPDEKINAILPVSVFSEEQYVMMATRLGTVKKVALSQFSHPRSNGIIACGLNEGDELVGVALSQGEDEAMLFTDAGKAIRFRTSDVRAMGRTACGVRGVELKEGQRVIALLIAKPDGLVLTATAQGYGKCTPVEDYRVTGRGGQGVISIQVNERNGSVVAAQFVSPSDDVILISDKGRLVRIPAAGISVVSRNTQGVRLISLDETEQLSGVVTVMELQEAALSTEEGVSVEEAIEDERVDDASGAEDEGAEDEGVEE